MNGETLLTDKVDDRQEDRVPKELRIYQSQFLSLWSNSHEKNGFLFFTDPHLLSSNNEFGAITQSKLVESFSSAEVLYNNLPIEFCICGGDWLNNGDTPEVAKKKLLFADTVMKGIFPCYYKMLGNHDTNYLGVLSSEDSPGAKLQRGFIDSELFSETESAYYSFFRDKSAFFILDSGIDFETSIDNYRKEQLEWLARQLLTCTAKHIILGIHMFYDISANIFPMSREIVAICDAYNKRKCYYSSDCTFNYSESLGKVHLILSGHRHVDFLEYEYGIPVVGTCRFIKNGNPSYELCVLDYDTGYANMIRVGEGNNRIIQLCM